MENQIDYLEGENAKLKNKVDELEEENRKLKEELEKDNREVQVDVDKELLKANDYLINENKNLKEKVNQLEERLDNKEKVNKQLREDIGKMVMNNPS